jgi:hypothetical protein
LSTAGDVALGDVLTGFGGCFVGRAAGLDATFGGAVDRRRSRARIESALAERRAGEVEAAVVESSGEAGRGVSEVGDGLAAGRRADGAGAGSGVDRQANNNTTVTMPKCP